MQVDTLIANATIDEQVIPFRSYMRIPSSHLFISLRAITRSLLATGSPGLASAFTDAARNRLRQTSVKRMANANLLFERIDGIHAVPTTGLEIILARVRALYGAGMGFASLALLTSIVSATIGLRWEWDGSMAATLAVIDTDISQAIQVGSERFRCWSVLTYGAELQGRT